MRAAIAIINARSSIATAEGDKTTGELADFIEHETGVVGLIDAAQLLLRAVDEATDTPGETARLEPLVAQRVDELREALRSATARPATEASPSGRSH